MQDTSDFVPMQDISPLEMHHVAASFVVAQESGAQADPFQGMRSEDKAVLRASMIDLILGKPS